MRITFVLCTFFLCAQLSAQWISTGIGGGGAVMAPSISPFDSNEVYLACDMSDVFHSSDFGASWTTIPFQQLTGFHHTVVRFTNVPEVLYTLKNITGGYAPVKSTNAGNSWFAITNPAGASSAYKCYELYAHPEFNHILIISDKTKLYISHDGGSTFGSPFYTDAVTKGMHLAGVFFDGANVTVCTNKSLLVSSDTGHTFSQMPVEGINSAQEEIAWFIGTKQAGVTKFFCTTLSPNIVTPTVSAQSTSSFQNIYRMKSGDANWTSIRSGLPDPVNDKPYFIATAKNDTNTIYLAGTAKISVYGPIDVHSVFKSTDGGNTFNNVFLRTSNIQQNDSIATGWFGWGTQRHTWTSGTDALGFAVDPNNADRIIVTHSSNPHVSTCSNSLEMSVCRAL
ncbi:MAG: hypothetical protein HY960_12795 [Ignavibacteriae bacterium]|nr:hypothetical protein [Ignavibacteriota bacterium]